MALAWTNLAWAVRYNIYRAPSSQMPDTALATVVADDTCEYFDASGEVVYQPGAKVKIVNGANDITEVLNVPAADGNGVVDLTKATVKDEIVREALDPKKGAVGDLSGGPLGATGPTITTAPTKVGLTYTFREGTTLEGFGAKAPSVTKVGDGEKWSPEIKVKGGSSAFYSIGVGKGE